MKQKDYLEDYYYTCKYCGFTNCLREKIPEDGEPKTQTGTYGSQVTPAPVEYESSKYSATTISFTAASGDTPAKISDSAFKFGEKRFRGDMTIRVETTSGTNDGDYTIRTRGLTRGELLLSDDDSLTTENAATAGTVSISRLTYQPNVTTGCPLCGTLNSR